MQSVRLVNRRRRALPTDLCTAFCTLYITARGLSTSAAHLAGTGSNNATPNPMHSTPPQTTPRGDKAAAQAQASRARFDAILSKPSKKLPEYLKKPSDQTFAAAAKPVPKSQSTSQDPQQQRPQLGGLASDSLLADESIGDGDVDGPADGSSTERDIGLLARSPLNMEARLNPRPNARARWMRLRVIRNVRRRGRLTRDMRLARTERSHVSKSRFFKTSMKKLAPLTRQIAGKNIDDAIMQMRFSKKKAAQEVLKHLIQARNEAVVIRGMGMPDATAPTTTIKVPVAEPQTIPDMIIQALQRGPIDSPSLIQDFSTDPTQSNTHLVSESGEILDASNTPPLDTQLPSKRLKKGHEPAPTDIYVAQAWINRGKYGKEPSYRARGRVDVLRPPHTGMSVMLKEEKTRSREKMEKEMKAVRKRLNGKGLWTALKDRPIQGQSQYVLW